MSELRSLIDEMSAVDDSEQSPEEKAADIVELEHVGQMIDVLKARKTKSLADDGGHQELGYASPTALLVHLGRMSAGHAQRIVANANAEDKAPESFAAWADGRVSTDQATQLFAMAEAVPDEFPESEQALVEIVEPLTVRETRIALEYWRQSVDGPGEAGLESQMLRRGFSLHETFGGMYRPDGLLTALAAQALLAGMQAHMPPPSEDDHRTPRQRNHDALEEMARCHIDHGELPTVGGEKPHMMILTDPEGLKGIAGGLHETLDGQVVDVEAIRLLACDCSVSRIILGPESEVLDVGRKTRVWSPAQRRAIVARDRTCTAKGCERPPEWCDIHHEDPWADGGETSVKKGFLLCRFHHVLEHIRLKKLERLRTCG